MSDHPAYEIILNSLLGGLFIIALIVGIRSRIRLFRDSVQLFKRSKEVMKTHADLPREELAKELRKVHTEWEHERYAKAPVFYLVAFIFCAFLFTLGTLMSGWFIYAGFYRGFAIVVLFICLGFIAFFIKESVQVYRMILTAKHEETYGQRPR